MSDRTRGRTEFAAALLLDLIGAGAALLISTRHWQTATILRERPLADRTLEFTGRKLDNAPTALALVALAGVVAIVAVRSWGRSVVGVVVAATGLLLVWRSLLQVDTISPRRVAQLYEPDRTAGFGIDTFGPQSNHLAWPVLSAACGVLIAVAGALVAVRGHRWPTLSARYDAPTEPGGDDEIARARREASLWQTLDRGDDPTDPDPPQPNSPGDDRTTSAG